MRILFIILFCTIVNAQIFQESFPSFYPDTVTFGTHSYNIGGAKTGNDEIATTNLSGSDGFSANYTDESVTGGMVTTTGKYLTFTPANDEYITDATAFDIGLNDLAVQIGFKTGSSLTGTMYLVNETNVGIFSGWRLFTNEGTLSFQPIDGAATNTIALNANAWYYVVCVADRQGSSVMVVTQGNDAGVSDSDNISAQSGTNCSSPATFTVGAYAENPATGEWNGGIDYLKITIGTGLLSSQERWTDDIYLADGWVDKVGGLARGNGQFGFRQGIEGSGITITTTEGAFSSEEATLPNDSTRFTFLYPAVNGFASDSIKFVGGFDGEIITHLLPDTALPAGYGVRLIVDLWEPIGGYVYIDNITLEGYVAGAGDVTTGTRFETEYLPWNNSVTW